MRIEDDRDLIDVHLTEGRAFRCDCVEPMSEYHFMPVGDMVDQIDRTRLVVHGNVLQPGVAVVTRCVELERYPPMTPRNDLMQLWNFRLAGHVWVAFTVPAADEPYVAETAGSAGLLLNPTAPTLMYRGAVVAWPIGFGFHLTPGLGAGFYVLGDLPKLR